MYPVEVEDSLELSKGMANPAEKDDSLEYSAENVPAPVLPEPLSLVAPEPTLQGPDVSPAPAVEIPSY